MDYYDELGLTASATDLDIKKACVPARRARPRASRSSRDATREEKNSFHRATGAPNCDR